MQDFYQHQEVAKSNSASLIVMMCGAVLGTVLVTGFVITAIIFGTGYTLTAYEHGVQEVVNESVGQGQPEDHFIHLGQQQTARPAFPWDLAIFFFCTISAASGAFMVAITYGKIMALRKGGGAAVARGLGGVLLGDDAESQTGNPYRDDKECNRAVNIVEEMAIAAGLSPPPVFLLAGQRGINAFAVGSTREDAVLGLTEGAVRKLSREQLQGVVAHEFAHIFNGDMQLNLKMIGYMQGILAVAIGARAMIKMGSDMMANCEHRNAISTGLLLEVVGAILYPVGMIGNLFASLIKAAFSRQREYLADAYAVQFTRNAEGVAGALKRIMGHGQGSKVRHTRAMECSHLFFADGQSFLQLLSSHPPIERRIRRIDPHWDGRPIFDEETELGELNTAFEGTMNFMASSSTHGVIVDNPLGEPLDGRLKTFDVVGAAGEAHLAALKAGIPELLWELSHEMPGASVQVLGLWYASQDSEAAARSDLQRLQDSKLGDTVAALTPLLHGLDGAERLLLLDETMDSLRTAKARSFQQFRPEGERLAASTPSNSFQWAWQQILRQIIRDRMEQSVKPRFGSLEPVLGACEVVVSSLAHAGTEGPMAAFSVQRAVTQLGHELTLRDRDDCTLETLSLALNCLSELSPRRRREVLLACGATISSDQDVEEEEACLIRGICAAMGHPPARLLPGQPVAVGA